VLVARAMKMSSMMRAGVVATFIAGCASLFPSMHPAKRLPSDQAEIPAGSGFYCAAIADGAGVDFTCKRTQHECEESTQNHVDRTGDGRSQCSASTAPVYCFSLVRGADHEYVCKDSTDSCSRTAETQALRGWDSVTECRQID
jgi:hypothetical protein